MTDQERWNGVVDVADRFSSLIWQANTKFLELGKLSHDALVLDVGCGTGELTRAAASQLSTVGKAIGIDIAPAMVSKAKERQSAPNLDFHVHDAHAMRFKDGVCDVVFCRSSLPFFSEPARVLERSLAVLKPGGRIVLMTLGAPTHNGFFAASSPASPKAFEQAMAFGDAGALKKLLEKAGFEKASARSIRALVRVDDPGPYWEVVRGAVGLAEPEMPASVRERLPAGVELPLEIVFALGHKPDPSVKQVPDIRSLDALVAAARRKIQEMTPYEVKKNLKKNEVRYVDVREPSEREEGRIPEAIHIPRGELERRITSEIPDPTTPIVMISERGDLSALAAERLVNMGYSSVWNLYGGFTAWKEDGMSVEVGE